MSKRTTKNSKLNTTLMLFYVDTRYRFVPKGGTFHTETIRLVVRSLYPNLPQMGQIFYNYMLIPLHDTMPSFMNYRRVLDLLEFKNQVSQCFAGNQWCLGV